MHKEYTGLDKNGIEVYRVDGKRVCLVETCLIKYNKQGLCSRHYREIMEKEICSVDKCESKVVAKSYCNKHYHHINRHGKIMKRTVYDNNEIILHKDYAEIKMFRRNGEYSASTVIDLDDVKDVSKYKWHLNDNGYARNRELNIYLHQFVFMTEFEDIDHKNHNTLDNRKSNLRGCHHADNNKNSKKSRSVSGFKGVYFHKAMNKWYSTIGSDNLSYTSHFSDNMNDVIRSREMMELFLHGQYSPRYEMLKEKYGEISIQMFNELVRYRNVVEKRG